MNNNEIAIESNTLEELNQAPILWRYCDLAKYLQVSEHKLRRDVMERKIPFTKIGKCTRFVPEEIHEWLRKNTVLPEQR